MASSKLPASKVLEMIECEIEGLPLKETGYRADVSETACFNFRQRLYAMASIQLENIQLHGQTEVDSTYAKINLSGTKPENMPRLSKKRGRKDPVIGEHDALRGLSHHKVCIAAAIDEYDNILYRVSGLGKESFEKYISAFARTHAKKQDTVPSGGHTTKSGNSLGDVNQLHQTLKDLSRSKHGVSTRHLPGYLNWISYLKRKKYTVEREKLAEVIFKDLYETEGTVLRDEICKTEQPVSLYEAYHEYHYGIFKDA